MAWYIDTSALLKLVVAETETTALRTWLTEVDRDLVSNDLARAEMLRAVRRAAPDRVVQARKVLDALTLLKVTTTTFEAAGLLSPAILRTLDAIHIASALELGDDLQGVITYDERLAAAARDNGISAVSPAGS